MQRLPDGAGDARAPVARAAPDDGAYGAEFVLTPKTGGMETRARPRRADAREGKGMILDQFANPDNPLAHYATPAPRSGATPAAGSRTSSPRWAPPARSWAFAFPQGKESGDHRSSARSPPKARHPGHPQVAGGLPAEDLRPRSASTADRGRDAGRSRGDGAAPRARGGHLRAASPRAAAARSRCASRARSRTRRSCSSSATAATAICRPACSRARSRLRMTPILVFDIETVPDVAGLRSSTRFARDAERCRGDRLVQPAAPRSDRQRFPARCTCSRSSRSPARCASDDGLRVWSLGDGDDPEPELDPPLLRRHRQATRRSSCPGTAAASTCRCCTIAR